MIKKDISIGSLIGIVLMIGGAIVALYVRVAITEQDNIKQDERINDNTEQMRVIEDKREKDRNEIQLKLDRIIENQSK